MFGNNLMGMPRTMGEAKKIYEQLELDCDMRDDHFFSNAVKLVDMNNEIYDKHKNKTWLKERIKYIEHRNFVEDFNCGH